MSTVWKQRDLDVDVQLIFSFVFSLRPQPRNGATNLQDSPFHLYKPLLETPSQIHMKFCLLRESRSCHVNINHAPGCFWGSDWISWILLPKCLPIFTASSYSVLGWFFLASCMDSFQPSSLPYLSSVCSHTIVWWFVCAWPREWQYLEVWLCWSRCVTVSMGFNHPSCLETSLQMKM